MAKIAYTYFVNFRSRVCFYYLKFCVLFLYINSNKSNMKVLNKFTLK